MRQKKPQPSAAFSAVASGKAQPARGSLWGSKVRDGFAFVGAASALGRPFGRTGPAQPPNESVYAQVIDAWSPPVVSHLNAEALNRTVALPGRSMDSTCLCRDHESDAFKGHLCGGTTGIDASDRAQMGTCVE